MTTLLALVEELLTDPGTRAAYQAEPDGFLDRRGFGGLDADDVSEALTHAVAVLPPAVAVQVSPDDGLDTLTQVEHGPFDDGPAAHDAAFDLDDGLFGSPGDDLPPGPAADRGPVEHDGDAGHDDQLGRDVDFDQPAPGTPAQLGADRPADADADRNGGDGGSRDDVAGGPAGSPSSDPAPQAVDDGLGSEDLQGADALADPVTFVVEPEPEPWFQQSTSSFDEAGFDEPESDILDDADTLGDQHDG